MINRLIGLSFAILAAMVFASAAHAQARGGFLPLLLAEPE